jgi:hypothetical protein
MTPAIKTDDKRNDGWAAVTLRGLEIYLAAGMRKVRPAPMLESSGLTNSGQIIFRGSDHGSYP